MSVARAETRLFQEQLILWYATHQRCLPWRDTSDPYGIWVSEVMLQQTQVRTVVPYYERFLHRFPDAGQLACAHLQEVLKLWEGLGYYARARNLHKAARVVMEKNAGIIPDDAKMFRELPGVGEYIAAAVLSIAFGQLHAVVDGNVKRVLARLQKIDHPVNRSTSHKYFREAAQRLLDRQDPGRFNQAMMELGALVCTPRRPECSNCPLQRFCSAFRSDAVGQYPRRVESPKTPQYQMVAGVVYKEDKVLITQRKPDGLLGGLWEFPGGKVRDGEPPETACLREIAEGVNLTVEPHAHIARVKHAYTHFRIILDVFQCRYLAGNVRLSGPIDFRWLRFSEIGAYPFSGASHKFIPLLRQSADSLP